MHQVKRKHELIFEKNTGRVEIRSKCMKWPKIIKILKLGEPNLT